jgi:hypothetical protein
VTNAPPAGRHFVTVEGLPTDYYLRLTFAATRMMRGENAADGAGSGGVGGTEEVNEQFAE